MTWFKVDDSFYDHPKVFDAPDCAVALWTRAGCWSARNLTEGFVPASLPARLCGDPDTAVADLLRRGLWLRTSGGYRFHDWRNYQPTAAEVADLRRKRQDAGRRGGLAKAGKQTASNSQANGRPVGKQNAAPTRPEGSVVKEGSKGGTSVTREREEEPPIRCEKHTKAKDPPACGACADARREHNRWEIERTKRLASEPKCKVHRGQLAESCSGCRSEELSPP